MRPDKSKRRLHSDRRRCRQWLAILMVVFLGLSLATDAWARAGGGGGFSGGGGGGSFGGGGGGFSSSSYSGSSYSGSGGGSGGPASPAAVVIGFACLIIMFFSMAVQTYSGSSGRTGRPAPWSPPGEHFKNLAKLYEVDSSFDWDSFQFRIEQAFLQVQDAWQKQELDPVLHYISDSIYERFSLQIAEQIRAGYRDHMPQIDVLTERMGLSSVQITDHFEIIDVSITCSAIDYRVSLKTKKPLGSTNTTPESFVEIWSFIRRRGVKSTPNGRGLFEGNCPNCATALELNQVGACTSCEAVLRNGDYDWVLAEITQASVWRPRTLDHAAPTIASYRATHDAGFTMQHIEDRASVIFWRKVLADRESRIDPLRKMATAAFCNDYEVTLKDVATMGHREIWHDCAVGSVDCLGVICDGQADYTLLKIRWAGNKHRLLADGSLEDLHEWNRLNSLLVLTRNVGVRSDLNRIITSAHCPSCGAPESDITSHTCDFCNQVVNDGRFDWVLHHWLPLHSELAVAWKAKLADSVTTGQPTSTQPNPSLTDALDWAVQAVVADKTISVEENLAVLGLAARQGISHQQAQSLVNQATQNKLTPPTPSSKKEGLAWLTIVTDVVVADGIVQDAEKEVLQSLGKHLEMSSYDINLLLAKSQSKQHQRERSRRRHSPDVST